METLNIIKLFPAQKKKKKHYIKLIDHVFSIQEESVKLLLDLCVVANGVHLNTEAQEEKFSWIQQS